ncbi:MAG: SurA N-terminal domain-containing protein [Bacteriovoracaceae bacterium]|nr:SurA N-terminal domain-containing protein [Bacteriovoracaceae bacterium]
MKNTKYISLLFALLLSFSAQARLLDKIVAVFNDKVITHSQVKRVKRNLAARRNISPAIYNKKNFKDSEVAKLITNRLMIRAKLSELGYIIEDDQVESQIKSTEKRLRLNRSALLQFLSSNNMTFDEYFEIIRETIEYNIFSSRVIQPLISITEQEIKNRFYRKNINNKTLNFKYNLVDFTFPRKKMSKRMKAQFSDMLKKFQTTGILPSKFQSLETNVLGDITEDGLTRDLKRLLKKTDEGSFSRVILIGSHYHVFFIKKKDLVASEIFKRAKPRIKQKIFEENASKITSLWFKREQNKHYLKYFL